MLKLFGGRMNKKVPVPLDRIINIKKDKTTNEEKIIANIYRSKYLCNVIMYAVELFENEKRVMLQYSDFKPLELTKSTLRNCIKALVDTGYIIDSSKDSYAKFEPVFENNENKLMQIYKESELQLDAIESRQKIKEGK